MSCVKMLRQKEDRRWAHKEKKLDSRHPARRNESTQQTEEMQRDGEDDGRRR